MNNLKKIRATKNISDKEMANKIGISLCMYVDYEENPMTIPTSVACKIARVLNCTLEHIFLPASLQNEDL